MNNRKRKTLVLDFSRKKTNQVAPSRCYLGGPDVELPALDEFDLFRYLRRLFGADDCFDPAAYMAKPIRKLRCVRHSRLASWKQLDAMAPLFSRVFTISCKSPVALPTTTNGSTQSCAGLYEQRARFCIAHRTSTLLHHATLATLGTSPLQIFKRPASWRSLFSCWTRKCRLCITCCRLNRRAFRARVTGRRYSECSEFAIAL